MPLNRSCEEQSFLFDTDCLFDVVINPGLNSSTVNYWSKILSRCLESSGEKFGNDLSLNYRNDLIYFKLTFTVRTARFYKQK